MIELFQDGEFALDVERNEDGSFIVHGPGLAQALGFYSVRDMLRGLAPVDKGSGIIPTPGGPQEVGYVTESGFYRVIGQRQVGRIKDPNQRAAAERFQAWVFGEVLPALREHKTYGVEPQELDREEILVMALEETRKAKALEAQNAELAAQVGTLAPAARAWEHLGDVATDYGVREAAQILSSDPTIDTGQRKLMATLRELKWVGQGNVPFQSHLEGGTGRLAAKVTVFTDTDGVEHPRTTTRITHKGLTDLHRMLGGTAELVTQEPLRLVVAS